MEPRGTDSDSARSDASTTWRAPIWLDRLSGGAWRLIVIVAMLAIVVVGLVALHSIIVPLMLGSLFACGLYPLAARLRTRTPSSLAAAIAVLALVAVLTLAAWLTLTTVVDQWDEIAASLAAGRAKLEQAAIDAGLSTSTAELIGGDLDETVSSVVGSLLEGVALLVPTVTSVVASLVLSMFVAFFFLKDGPVMWRWCVDRVGGGRELTDHIGTRVWTTLSAFLRGQAVIAAIDATGIALGATLLGLPNPAAIFMITFIGAFVPYIGAFISGLVAVLVAVGDSGLGTGLVMLAIVVGVQVLEGNVLQPWIQGRAVTLHPLVIALSVTAGGAIAGFLGVLLAVPITASVVVALSELRAAGIVGTASATAPTPARPPDAG